MADYYGLVIVGKYIKQQCSHYNITVGKVSLNVI